MPRFHKQPPNQTWGKHPRRLLKFQINNVSKKQNLIWGNFGLRAVGKGVMHMHSAEDLDLYVNQTLKRSDKQADTFLRLQFEFPWTKKPTGYRMGKGKGKVERYYSGVAAGDIFYEMKTTKALAVKEVYDRLKIRLPFDFEIVEQPSRPEGVRSTQVPTRSQIIRMWAWKRGVALKPFEIEKKGAPKKAPKK